MGDEYENSYSNEDSRRSEWIQSEKAKYIINDLHLRE